MGVWSAYQLYSVLSILTHSNQHTVTYSVLCRNNREPNFAVRQGAEPESTWCCLHELRRTAESSQINLRAWYENPLAIHVDWHPLFFGMQRKLLNLFFYGESPTCKKDNNLCYNKLVFQITWNLTVNLCERWPSISTSVHYHSCVNYVFRFWQKSNL